MKNQQNYRYVSNNMEAKALGHICDVMVTPLNPTGKRCSITMVVDDVQFALEALAISLRKMEV